MLTRRLLTGYLTPELISTGAEWLRTLGAEFNLSHEDLYRMEVCFEELITNVVNYSAPQYASELVHVHVFIETLRATLTLTDSAAPFDPFSRAPPSKVNTIEEMQIGGQGVQLVRSISDSYRYERLQDKNQVELVFDLSQPTRELARQGQVVRQLDRRRSPARVAEDELALDKRSRSSEDRRSLGFISWSEIFHGVPYGAVEATVDQLTLQDIVGKVMLLKRGDMNDAVRGCPARAVEGLPGSTGQRRLHRRRSWHLCWRNVNH
ncbi:MAG: ATP-binding protein [Comamonadaceae bacterium]|nr:ATP-binding protein [Comamonadaceae bacterium]